MQKSQRKILNQLAGVSFIIGTMCIIWMFIYLVQHPACAVQEHTCIIQHPNKSVEDTGLYGNCAYLNKYMEDETYGGFTSILNGT